MHVNRQFRALADFGRHFHHANAPAREAADFRMGLDAANEIAIGHRRFHGRVDIDAIGL